MSLEGGEGAKEKGGALRDEGAGVRFLRERGWWWKGRSANQRLVWTGPSGRRGCEGSLWRVKRAGLRKLTYCPCLPIARTPQSKAWGPGVVDARGGAADSELKVLGKSREVGAQGGGGG